MELGVADKIRFLREATRGPDDVFAVRKVDGSMKWGPVYAGLTDLNLTLHLQGLMEVGVYPLLPQAREPALTWWIAADFDSHSRPGSIWQHDVQRAVTFLAETGAALIVNLSRSADGAHVRVLFKEPVPAWMARRWLMAWLVEAEVATPDDNEREFGLATSFDRTVPMQDALPLGLNPKTGKRHVGNLIGSPLHGGHARRCGGTLPLSIENAAAGNFDPDGKHWEHLVRGVEQRSWGVAELRDQLAEVPGEVDLEPPDTTALFEPHRLPVFNAPGAVAFTAGFCEFLKVVRNMNPQPYDLWLALAANLHAFGEDGRLMFHEISQSDSRYQPSDCEQKWNQTYGMHPVRCDTIATLGYRCPHLGTNRCGGAMAPAYLFEMSRCQPIEEVLEAAAAKRGAR